LAQKHGQQAHMSARIVVFAAAVLVLLLVLAVGWFVWGPEITVATVRDSYWASDHGVWPPPSH